MKQIKSQGGTEYLIILAVVIIIALLVVGVMGGFPGIGTKHYDKIDMCLEKKAYDFCKSINATFDKNIWRRSFVCLDGYRLEEPTYFNFLDEEIEECTTLRKSLKCYNGVCE